MDNDVVLSVIQETEILGKKINFYKNSTWLFAYHKVLLSCTYW